MGSTLAARFDVHLGQAQTDWRDVLVAAGLAHQDWPRVLESRGIQPTELSPDTLGRV